jgi:hypothetical protein
VADDVYLDKLIKSLDEEIGDKQKVVDADQAAINAKRDKLNRLTMGRKVLAGEVSLASSDGPKRALADDMKRGAGAGFTKRKCGACKKVVAVHARTQTCPKCGVKGQMGPPRKGTR